MPQTLGLRIGLDDGQLLVGAAGQPQVGQRLVIDREDRHGRAVLRAHVADRGPVGQRHCGHTLPVELHELADDAVLAQLLRDGEHEVGGGRSGRQRAAEFEADHPRNQHADRLPEHRSLGLDATDTPAQDTQAVDHRGVGVGADAGVGVGLAVAHHDHARKVLDVHLVHDPRAGRDHLELVEGALPPAQELVALAVAFVLQRDVELQRLLSPEVVGDDAVVNHELGGGQRVDPVRVAAHLGERLAHRGQINHARHTGEVLHDHARRRELDLLARLGASVPRSQGTDLLGGDVCPVLGAQQVLQQNPVGVREVEFTEGVEREILERLLAHLQRRLGTETVETCHAHLPSRGPQSSLVVGARPDEAPSSSSVSASTARPSRRAQYPGTGRSPRCGRADNRARRNGAGPWPRSPGRN